MVVVQFSEGVDQMGTEVRVDVLGHKLSNSMSILGPVGVIAHSPLARSAASCIISKLDVSGFKENGINNKTGFVEVVDVEDQV